MLHYITTCANWFFMLKRELELLPTAFAVILTLVALTIVPNYQVQKAAICNLSSKLTWRCCDLHVFTTIVGRKTSLPERFVIIFLHLLICKSSLHVQTTLLWLQTMQACTETGVWREKHRVVLHAVKNVVINHVCLAQVQCIYLFELWCFGVWIKSTIKCSLWNNQVSFIANVSSGCDAISAN